MRMKDAGEEETVITRGEAPAPKGPQNAKERMYEKLRGVPLWVIDAVLIALGVAIVVALVLGYLKGNG
ncbi:MAG: hypothetical protein RR696_08990 [Clostridia bacterium]